MSFLFNLLEKHGFIEQQRNAQNDDAEEKDQKSESPKEQPDTTPSFFPVYGKGPGTGTFAGGGVSNYKQQTESTLQPDEAFIKFFEDEMGERNPPGLDYFEFRQQYMIMQQKMPDADTRVILQAVITNFETNDVHTRDLLMSASFYKGVLTDKKNLFLQDSANEKKMLLTQRERKVNEHGKNIEEKKAEAARLQKRLYEIDREIQEEQTNLELAQTAGNEMIEEFNNAELKLTAACEYMLKTIEDDIHTLSTLK